MAITAARSLHTDRDRTRVALGAVCVVLAGLGFAALVSRPTFPAPAGDVSAWLPSTIARSHWDRLYVAHAAITVLRPVLLVALLVTPPGRWVLRRATAWMSDSTLGATMAPVTVLVAVDLVTLPIAWWGRLSREPAGAWLADWVVTHAQTWAVVGLFAAGLVVAMRRWQTTWHWRAALVGIALAALVPLAGDLDPLADPLAPLPEGPTRLAVEAGAVAAGAEDIPILVGSGGAAAELGAYVSGIGPSRAIVLSSELLAFPAEQVAFVAMHEFAHREHLDVHRKVLATAAGLVTGLWLLERLLRRPRVEAHLRAAVAPGPRRMIIALALAAVLSAVAAPISNLATRQSEGAADWRALEVTADPASAIGVQRYLVDRGASDPDPPAWYRNWLATHPDPGYRIGLAVRYAELHGIPLRP